MIRIMQSKETVMARRACIQCGRQRRFFALNYAGIRLDRKKPYNPFPNRISPRESPGNRRVDFLCVDCARRITVSCTEHGAIRDNTWSRRQPPRCTKCVAEAKLGPPPEGYDCIEAVECLSSQGSLLGDTAASAAYLERNPCTCGGKWDLIVYNSPMPSGIADAGYRCSSCGKKKWFRFIMWR
jgi:hypothetical protein